MIDFIKRLPEEIEREIKSYLIPNGRLSLLLYKYPLSQIESFFKGFSKEQLDRVYRYGCYEKIDLFNYNNKCFDRDSINLLYKDRIGSRDVYADTRRYALYCDYGLKVNANISVQEREQYVRKYCPTKPEFIRRIKRFCVFLILQARKHSSNKKIWSACHKILYEVLIGSLIMRRDEVKTR